MIIIAAVLIGLVAIVVIAALFIAATRPSSRHRTVPNEEEDT
jgi:hypothetical protein